MVFPASVFRFYEVATFLFVNVIAHEEMNIYALVSIVESVTKLAFI